MKKFTVTVFVILMMVQGAALQTPQKPEQIGPEDVIRISTELVQTDVVVADKNDQPITDLKLEDFELYDNGKKQDIKFMEFVSVDSGRRAEGDRTKVNARVDLDATSSGVSANEVRRVLTFVIDDLTIPDSDLL